MSENYPTDQETHLCELCVQSGIREALRQSEERYRLAARATQDALWDFDLNSGRMYLNEAYISRFGRPQITRLDDISWWLGRIHPDDRERIAAHARFVFEGTVSEWVNEYRYLATDGSYAQVLDRGHVVRDSDGRIRRIVGVLADLTMHKRMEEMEQECQHYMRAAAAMDQVLGAVGHELRTPLAALRAMSEFLLTEGVAPNSDRDHFVRRINDEVVRMSNIVDELLEAARLNSGRARWNWSRLSLKEVCGNAIDQIAPLIDSRHVRLTCRIEPEDATMMGDASAIRRLLLNLLANARKHTPQGEIRLSAAACTDAGRQWIEISLQDTGTGIGPQVVGRLGQPFALNAGAIGATEPGGAGLGLSICRAIAGAHGGDISIHSRPAAGTRVVVRLRRDLDGPSERMGKIRFHETADLQEAQA